MLDLRINIRTKEVMNITPCKKCCLIQFVSSIISLASNPKLRRTEIGKELTKIKVSHANYDF